MKSKVTLEIAEGGTLLGSKDLKDYPLTRPAYRSYTDCLKSTSPSACQDVTIRNCTVASQGNVIKCGTESVGGFKNVTISHCTVKAPSSEGRFRVRNIGLAGVALEIVDGGTMDQVNVSDIETEGTMVPIFVRLGDRGRPHQQDAPRPGVGVLRNVTISGIRASCTDAMGCAVAGLKGHPIEGLTLRDIRIKFPGNGLATDSLRSFDEKARAYPECKMFAKRLPAYVVRDDVWGYFYRVTAQSPGSGDIEHWFSNAGSCFLIGDASGRAMMQLLSKGGLK